MHLTQFYRRTCDSSSRKENRMVFRGSYLPPPCAPPSPFLSRLRTFHLSSSPSPRLPTPIHSPPRARFGLLHLVTSLSLHQHPRCRRLNLLRRSGSRILVEGAGPDTMSNHPLPAVRHKPSFPSGEMTGLRRDLFLPPLTPRRR